MKLLKTKFVIASLGVSLVFCYGAFASEKLIQLITTDSGWAVGKDQHLYWTNDNGSHWTDIYPRGMSIPSDTFFFDVSHGWVLLASGRGDSNMMSFNLACTSDSGRTWALQPIKVPAQTPDELDGRAWLDFVDPLHGWVVLHMNSSSAFSRGLLLATEDGGRTWNELKETPVAGRPMFVTPQDGWISGPSWSGIYRTRNGGKSWQGAGPLLTDLAPSLPTQPASYDIKFTDAKHGFLTIALFPSTMTRRHEEPPWFYTSLMMVAAHGNETRY